MQQQNKTICDFIKITALQCNSPPENEAFALFEAETEKYSVSLASGLKMKKVLLTR